MRWTNKKQPTHPTPAASTAGPCPTICQRSRMPRYWKLPSTIAQPNHPIVQKLIYLSSFISWPSFKPLAQIDVLFEISWQDFTPIFSKRLNSRWEITPNPIWHLNFIRCSFGVRDISCYPVKILYELPHDKTNKMACAPSEDSDQPGHPPSLIRVFAVRVKKAWVLSYPLSVQQRLRSDWADA